MTVFNKVVPFTDLNFCFAVYLPVQSLPLPTLKSLKRKYKVGQMGHGEIQTLDKRDTTKFCDQ